MPEAEPLALLRRDVDRKSHKIKRVLLDTGLRNEFFGGIPKNERKVVKAFVNQNSENALKTKPKVRPNTVSMSNWPRSTPAFAR